LAQEPRGDRRFVGDAIRPVAGSGDATAMARGEPGLPLRFRWREADFEVAAVLARWRETGPCTSGSGERYVRRHWFRIRTTSGEEMEIYCDRQPRRGANPRARWWLFAIVGPR
jgi:phosphoribosylglycinamide formyltransferase-1